jgi:predicted AAA+ superfamily ATPase
MEKLYFVVTDRRGRKLLIQVSMDIDGAITRKRELEALCEAMEECDLTEATVVTLDLRESLETESGHIHIVPARLWPLQLCPPSPHTNL